MIAYICSIVHILDYHAYKVLQSEVFVCSSGSQMPRNNFEFVYHRKFETIFENQGLT